MYPRGDACPEGIRLGGRAGRGVAARVDWDDLLASYAAAGYQDLAQFWWMTPRDLSALFDGAEKRLAREQDARVELAWTVEVLARQKRLPSLRDLLGRRRRKTVRRDPADEFAAWVAWAAAYSPS